MSGSSSSSCGFGKVAETGVGIGEEIRIPLTPLRGDFKDEIIDDTRECDFEEFDFVSSIFRFAGRTFSIFRGGVVWR